MISEEVRLSVKYGANFMDENFPGWADKINLSKLDMGDCEVCIIGQAVGNYFEVIDNHSDYSGWATEYGFDIVEIYNYKDQYSQLEEAWTEEVKNRR